MLPGDEINSAVDQGPCLSLDFIRCLCWLCARTTCFKKRDYFQRKGERDGEEGEKVGEKEGRRESERFWISSTVHLDKKTHMNTGIQSVALHI